MEALIIIGVLYSIAMYGGNAVWFLVKLDGSTGGGYSRRSTQERRNNIRHARSLGTSFFVAPFAFPFVAVSIMMEHLNIQSVDVEHQEEQQRRDGG